MTAPACPQCAGTDLRRANDAEMNVFYGGTSFVLQAPWKCKSCGLVWEPPPPKIGALLMVVLSACGLLVGLALFAVGVVGVIALSRGQGNAIRLIVIAVPAVPVFWASLGALRRYWRRLWSRTGS